MSLAAVGIIGQFAGNAMQAAGQKKTQEAQAEALEYSAKQNERNAELLTKEWLFNEATARAINRQKVSTTKAEVSEAGLTNSVSGMAVIAQTETNAERDNIALRMRTTTSIENFLTQATLDKYYAKKTREGASFGFFANMVGAGATAVSGLARNYASSNTSGTSVAK